MMRNTFTKRSLPHRRGLALGIAAILVLIVSKAAPIAAQGADASYVHIAAGSDFTFAIQSNGTLWAWGDNTYGELGDGTTTTRMQPVAVAEPAGAAPSSRWVRIFAHVPSTPVYGLRSDQTLWRWGANQTRPVVVPLAAILLSGATLLDLSFSAQHCLALYSDGTLMSWGANSQGQLGIGAAAGTGSVATPTPVVTPAGAVSGTRWTSIEADANQSFAVRSDGTLWSWGGVPVINPSTLGHPVTAAGCFTPEPVPHPAGAASGTGWASVEAGETHTLGLRSDGTLWAWGFSNNGALGQGIVTTSTAAPLPVPVPAGLPVATRWQRVQAGSHTNQGILSNGSLWTWGYNLFGQLGANSSNASEFTPQQEYNQETWTQSALGVYHAVALSRGRVYVTGNGPNGQLGLGNATSRLYFFVRVVGLPLAVQSSQLGGFATQLFPNPVASGELITGATDATKNSDYAALINSHGQTVCKILVADNRFVLPATAPGIYLIRFYGQERFLGTSRITIK